MMCSRPRQLAVAVALACLPLSFTAQSETLRDIYELALENDAQLKAQAAQYRADLELEDISLAALLPQVNGAFQIQHREFDSVSPTIIPNADGGFDIIDGSRIQDTDTDTWEVSLTQPLFDLSAWYNWKAGKEQAKQAEATFAAATQSLIVRVVEAYLAVLRAQDNLEAAEAQERAFERQLEQTQQRFEVGLIAITDVYESEAARDLAQVTRITEENNVAVAMENLSVLTGQSHGELFVLSEEFEAEPPMPAERAAWVDFALENNWNLKASRFGEEAARKTAKSNRMGHAPTVSARYSYQDNDQTGTQSQNPPSPFNLPPNSETTIEQWSVRVDVPLFSGGRVSANRRRAAEQYNAARENRINLQRQTVTDARSLHMTMSANVARVNAQKQSIKSTQSALDATEAGYEVGTRNIVDVLNAQNNVFGARRDYANSRYDYILSALRLKENAGTLSPDDIANLESYLVAPPAPTASAAK